MQKVLVRGVKIRGKSIDGAEVFINESQQIGKSELKKSKGTSVREPRPAWVVTNSFSPKWPFNFTINQIKRWWRLGIISEELMLIQCTSASCQKSAVIMREYYNGQIFCPYCKEKTQPVADQESYLTAMCEHILSRDGKSYTEEKS